LPLLCRWRGLKNLSQWMTLCVSPGHYHAHMANDRRSRNSRAWAEPDPARRTAGVPMPRITSTRVLRFRTYTGSSRRHLYTSRGTITCARHRSGPPSPHDSWTRRAALDLYREGTAALALCLADRVSGMFGEHLGRMARSARCHGPRSLWTDEHE